MHKRVRRLKREHRLNYEAVKRVKCVCVKCNDFTHPSCLPAALTTMPHWKTAACLVEEGEAALADAAVSERMPLCVCDSARGNIAKHPDVKHWVFVRG